ncbi:hypothetical protein [Latilactobacillus sakei]|uniref:hypothetical protein n=1 Tax=Latilactobacillus sakei TaxID=1599 RepID=UPI0020C75431|nr:hypothetical protein [Latilactobacillus sakei]MCP8851741.1 hypothetical protein [Latilactobacillus sakei]
MFGMGKQSKKDNFQEIIDSINLGLNNKNYIAALGMALTIPDICGKLEYGDIGNGQRYQNWYKNFIMSATSKLEWNEYPNGERFPQIKPDFDADIIYKLRCQFLHEGEITSDDLQKKFKDDSVDFELVLGIPNENGTRLPTSQLAEIQNGGKAKLELIINVEELCELLAKKGMEFHDENLQLFSNYKGLSKLEKEY